MKSSTQTALLIAGAAVAVWYFGARKTRCLCGCYCGCYCGQCDGGICSCLSQCSGSQTRCFLDNLVCTQTGAAVVVSNTSSGACQANSCLPMTCPEEQYPDS